MHNSLALLYIIYCSVSAFLSLSVSPFLCQFCESVSVCLYRCLCLCCGCLSISISVSPIQSHEFQSSEHTLCGRVASHNNSDLAHLHCFIIVALDRLSLRRRHMAQKNMITFVVFWAFARCCASWACKEELKRRRIFQENLHHGKVGRVGAHRVNVEKDLCDMAVKGGSKYAPVPHKW